MKLPSFWKSLHSKKTYHCGSMVYHPAQLVILFAWLLWGDFCFTLMEAVVPSILPLKLKSLEASNTLISLVMSTLPGIFNVTICPWISFKSDRFRSRWGRRIPFIVSTMPFLVIALIFIGFSDRLGSWIHRAYFLHGTMTQNAIIIILIIFFATMFDLFNMFVSSVYWYLFNDVVPEKFLASFMSWFRLVGALSAAFYHFFIYKYAISHMSIIYLSAALLYLLGFGAMCYKVKEGSYPPPTNSNTKSGLIHDIKIFVHDCYRLRYYWNIFLHTTLSAMASCTNIFMVFFHQSMGLSLENIGSLAACQSITVGACLLFAGLLVDRWHPVKTEAYLITFQTVFIPFNLIWIFVDIPKTNFYFWTHLTLSTFNSVLLATLSVSSLPRQMILFPKDRFGQFCGAQALIRSVGTLMGGILVGLFIDFIKRFFPENSLLPYRWIHLWVMLFTFLGFYFYYQSYRKWKYLGGEISYIPPKTQISPAPPLPSRSPINRTLLCIPSISFLGYFSTSLFAVFYFKFILPHPHNFKVFLVLNGTVIVLFFLYLKFIHLMEK